MFGGLRTLSPMPKVRKNSSVIERQALLLTMISLISATPQSRRSAGVVPRLRHQLPISGISSLQETHIGRPVAVPLRPVGGGGRRPAARAVHRARGRRQRPGRRRGRGPGLRGDRRRGRDGADLGPRLRSTGRAAAHGSPGERRGRGGHHDAGPPGRPDRRSGRRRVRLGPDALTGTPAPRSAGRRARPGPRAPTQLRCPARGPRVSGWWCPRSRGRGRGAGCGRRRGRSAR